jgi:hypothetical protein
MVFSVPYILKGKEPRETMDIVLRMLLGYVVLGTIFGVVGLVVWVRVLKGKEKRRQ